MTERPVPAPVPVTAADLVELVRAVPGVAGIEPGIGTTLRAIDARLRRSGTAAVSYGLHVDPSTGDVFVEIALNGPRPVREVVEQVQRAVLAALGGPGGVVLVRVQSLSR